MNLKYNIKKAVGLTDKELELYNKACKAMIYELNMPEYWNEVEYNWDDMTWKRGYDFNQFKDLVMSGNNNFDTDNDEVIDIYVTRYYSWRSVVGYTKPSTVMTWINRKFLNMQIDDFAAHIWHEQIHNYGFNHPNTDRNSLVYQCGYIMRDCVRDRVFIGEKPIEPVRLNWIQRVFKWLF